MHTHYERNRTWRANWKTNCIGRHMVPVLNAVGTDCACVGVSSGLPESGDVCKRGEVS